MEVLVRDRKVELTQEQLDMYGALTELQKNVALKKLLGLPDVEAYRQGGGKAIGMNSQTTSASEIINNPNVSQFIDSFNCHVVADAVMTRQEMLERLTAMARTDITDLVTISNKVVAEGSEGEEVEQSFWALKDEQDMKNGGVSAISELSSSREGLKIKIHDQKTAMKQIADIEGFNAAVRLSLGGDPNAPVQVVTMSKDEYRAAREEMLKSDDC